MKISNIKLAHIIGLFVLIITTSCSKESCAYVTDCLQKEPEGYMVATNANFITSNVGVIYKTTYNSKAPIGGDYNNPSLGANQVSSIFPAKWNVTDMGEVFGIALNQSGGIYLAATDVYAYDGAGGSASGTAGTAGIYLTDTTTLSTNTGFVTTVNINSSNTFGLNKIPNTGGLGNGIGNIAFDKKNNQLFVTNLEDGRIYRIDATTGLVKSIFDPFSLDVPASGIAPVGERLWGIGILTTNGNTSVYFARTEATLNSIWSIDLDATGEFVATQIGTSHLYNDSASSSKLIIQKIGIQNKISDIEFSCSGKMLLAERGGFHNSSIFEYVKSGTSWNPSISNFYVGGFSGQNSSGGVDYGARESGGAFTTDDIVWASGNYMITALNSYLVYGVQGINSLGNDPTITPNKATDLFIDRNASGPNNKGGMGDVDIFDSSCPCNN